MAKQLNPEDANPRTELTDKAYRAAVADINSEKAEAQSLNGSAAKLTKDFADKHDLDKKALTFVAGLARKERQQGQTILREIITGAKRMGLFDQVDAFDDLIPVMRGIVEAADAGASMAQEPRASGPVAVQ